jgi:hypothetical protein
MASNLIPLEVVQERFSETGLHQKQYYGVFSGSSESTYKRFTTSSFSTSSISWNCPPPNQDVLVSRCVIQDISFDVSFTGTTTLGANLLDGWGLTMALRALPIARSTKNMNARINDGSFSLSTNDSLTAFCRYGYNSMKREISGSPCYLDQSQNYDELINTIKNPLGSAFNSFDDNFEQRGSYSVQILTNTPTTATMRVRLFEPILLSPFHFLGKRETAFVGINSMDVTLTFDSNLPACLISKAPSDPAVFSNVSVTLTEQPALLFTYYSAQETMSIPREVAYPYVNVERYPTDYGGAVASGTTVQIASNNIQLNTIPRRIYVYARSTNNSLNINSTDTFLRIKDVNISFGNRSGLLASANAYQLYEVSKLAGCDLSWDQWYGTYNSGITGGRAVSGVGSVLCIDPGVSIGLDALSAPGILNNTQLQITCTFQNISPSNMNITMYVVVLNDGVINIVNGKLTTQIGILTSTEVLNASSNGVYIEHQQGEISGGFLTQMGAVKSKVVPFLKKALPVIETGAKIGRLMGLGEGGRRRRKTRGKGLIGGMDECDGGALVTRSELRDHVY